jgi:hypothetical protein
MKWMVWVVCLLVLPSEVLAGPTSAERKSLFEKAMRLILASATPQSTQSLREKLITEYLEFRPNKGFAIEPINGGFWRSPIHEDQNVTGDRTLEGCQMRYGKPCELIALNDDIVSEHALSSQDMPRLHYVGKYDVAQIPIIRMVTRKRPDVQNYDHAMEPKAMSIHPWGRVFMSVGNETPKEAQETALAKCNNDQERNGRDGRCFVYAVNNDVVISERRMDAK